MGAGNDLWERLIATCRPGAGAAELLAAYQAAGEPAPPMPVARGLGMGFDPPVVSKHLPATAAGERLEPGMVLAVTGYVWEQGVGAVFGAGSGADHRGWSRSTDVEPVLACLTMADKAEPSAEEIIRYDKDAKTRIATITFERPDYLNAPTIAARLRYADLLHRAGIDDDVKVLVVRGAGDDLGSGADLTEAMRVRDSADQRSRLAEYRVGADEVTILPKVRFGAAPPSASGMPTRTPGYADCRTSKRSASSRRRATATAGTSIRRPTPTW